MTQSTRMFGFALALGATAVLAAPASAQDPGPPQPPVETELVFDREVFQYPSFTRRNPFRALVGSGGGGPTFDQLTLIGIVYSEDPSASVAILSTGGVALADDGTMSAIEGEAFYRRVGETIGNVTIRAIHRDRVEVTVSEFDDQIPQTMTFVSRRPGGTQ